MVLQKMLGQDKDFFFVNFLFNSKKIFTNEVRKMYLREKGPPA